jgi:hypothetical protein
MQPGDLVALYVTHPVSGFIATVDVISDVFYDESQIWVGREQRSYPYRYRTRPRVVVSDGLSASVRELLPRLEIARYLRNPSAWGVMFQNAFREIPRADFELIEERLTEIAEP